MTKKKFKFIAGPCVIENRDITIKIAKGLKQVIKDLDNIDFYFKASFDKANRSSVNSFRGPGMEKGLDILREVKEKFGFKITTDIHLPSQIDPISKVADIIQIPAFLCRQTDLLLAAGGSGKTINVKKGQFLSPYEVKNIIEKVGSTGNKKIWITERGTTFGYNKLVVDMTSIPIMKEYNVPVIIDATHSVQLPGAGGNRTLGNREFVPIIAKAAISAGADGLFIETHFDPDSSPSDAANIYPLSSVKKLLKKVLEIFYIL
ncbi:3-deoxy-8-phosphooctulonate synthase [bacterium]|nr:3-deoxy-8-phosphooctulonate synthase [bacterium]